jgi:mRNA interferase RelE/StbE
LYKLKFLGKALADLKKIDFAHQKIIKEKLLILSKNPEALKSNIKKLAGTQEDLFRLRIGNYRVIFKKEKKELIIIIIRIGHRKEILAFGFGFGWNAIVLEGRQWANAFKKSSSRGENHDKK